MECHTPDLWPYGSALRHSIGLESRCVSWPVSVILCICRQSPASLSADSTRRAEPHVLLLCTRLDNVVLLSFHTFDSRLFRTLVITRHVHFVEPHIYALHETSYIPLAWGAYNSTLA